ncbi:lytic transglycosylase domain-containing protein [Escherichia coli]|uniref:lytic transglycosylase domain-containing protein n=1 Tax=Escherichia coli TaxID=562 RepID=UPI0024AD57E0|nr:lytic transglycosylase domain-containing protein [Escherichia coli]WHI18658.1 lytic transglycosylase domain-containing protein [Escherichia coli]
MAGNQMPVLTLDVNEEHLKRLEAIFEKYRNGLMIGPAGTPLKMPSNTGQGGGARQTTTGGEANQAPRKPSSPAPTDGRLRDEKGRFVGSGKTPDSLVSNYKGRGETMFDKYLSGLGKNAQQTLKTYKQINSTLQTTTSRLNNLFKTTVSWGTKLAVMGVAGPFGFGMMSRSVVEKQKNADELVATPGELKAAESTYSPYFSGVGNVLNTLAAAQNDQEHPARVGLLHLGINPDKNATENLPVFLKKVAELAKEYQGSGLTQSMLRGRGLGWVNFGLTNQLVKYQDKIPELNKEFSLRAAQNDSLLTSGHTSQYQNLTSNLENNWDRLTSGFQGALAGNAYPLIRISNGATNAALNFMNGENFKRILTDVEMGLDKLGKYINGPDFNNDLNNFAENVAKVTKALSGFVGFAVEHPWLFGAAVLAGPSRVGAVAATTTGVAARVVGGSLLGATAGTVAGLVIPTNNTPTTSEEMKGLEGRFNFDYFNEVQEWQKNNPGKVWPGKIGGDNNANLSQKEKLLAMVRAKARAALLPEGLMEAMIGVESGWNPNAISAKGAMGLPQFVKRTGNAYGLYGKDFYDPDKSTDAMVRYLIDNSNRYGSDIAKMLAQYNGGNAAVGKDNTLRLKSETVDYLLKLMAQIPAMREQRPMLEGKLRNAQQVLASNPGGRALIQLEVLQKPGSDILAQLAGMQQIPG